MKRWVLVAVVVALLATAVPGTVRAAPGASGSFIVVLRDGTDVDAVVARLGVRPDFTYTHALTGFAATLTGAQRRVLAGLTVVRAVVPNRTFKLADYELGEPATSAASGQVVPTGVRYIHADQSPTARIDGRDQRVDVDVAVMDSGIDRAHPDLNVAGGFSCVLGKSALSDRAGHGTAAAGVIGALDNQRGVVGVAPGARLWSIRVLSDVGEASLANMLCGVDVALLNAHRLEVVNISIGIYEPLQEDRCGIDEDLDIDPLHLVTCLLVPAGVVVVVSAGNESQDVTYSLPARYDQVLAVSALSDFDGSPGGLGMPPENCPNGSDGQDDDAFADFSNFGEKIDFIAPGVCLLTTVSGNRYLPATGTSFAAPLVAGAAALVKARRPHASPAEVRRILTRHAAQRAYPGDPDGIPEPTVDVAGL
jgi:subtilisin